MFQIDTHLHVHMVNDVHINISVDCLNSLNLRSTFKQKMQLINIVYDLYHHDFKYQFQTDQIFLKLFG